MSEINENGDTLFGSTIFKMDTNKPFSEEIILYVKKLKDVDFEIESDRIIILSNSKQKSNGVAIDIVEEFPFDLKLANN
jgi:hypothetical protein